MRRGSLSIAADGAATFGALGGSPADNDVLAEALAAKLDKTGGELTGTLGINVPAMSTADLINAQSDGSDRLRLANDGTFAIGDATGDRLVVNPSTGIVTVAGFTLQVHNGNILGTHCYLREDGPILHLGASDDVALGRNGAADTLLLGRKDENPNKLQIQNKWTSSTHHEHVEIGFDADVAHVWTAKGSTGGTARSLALGTDSTAQLTLLTDGYLRFGNGAIPLLLRGLYGDISWTQFGDGSFVVNQPMRAPRLGVGDVAYATFFCQAAAGWAAQNNTIEQRNGAEAQTLDVFNTFTSANVNERVSLGFDVGANVAHLWTAKGDSGGTARSLALGVDATAKVTLTTTNIILETLPSSDPGIPGALYQSGGVVMQSA